MSLFDSEEQAHLAQVQPLSARMRPRRLDEMVGQAHLLAEGALLRRTLDAGHLNSMILFGPPGSGKTTLAKLLAQHTRCRFRQINAISTGVKEIRECLDEARMQVETGGTRTLLFIDEIHRLHRGQQEVLLREIEEGIVVFVGATTANPYFALSSALISRCQVYELKPLDPAAIRQLLYAALRDPVRGLGAQNVQVDADALDLLSQICDGDARRALQTLEWAVRAAPRHSESATHIAASAIREVLQRKAGVYDRGGDAHYDHASALIKSIRGSDPDAAIYWLARMLEAGEEIRFLCRRLVILASEDIGNADPRALLLATSAMQACEFVGLPECQFALAQAVIYLSLSPKSNACTQAIGQARRDVRESRIVPVPRFLRDSHSASARATGHGDAYVSPHDSPDGMLAQEYLGIDAAYYLPVPRGREAELIERLKELRQKLREGREDGG